MESTSDYVDLKINPEASARGRVTKAKLGITWSEFVARAAEELDPDEQTTD
jgi:hypothetical protein